MRTIQVFLLVFVVAGCATSSQISDNEAIPRRSNVIYLQSNEIPSVLFDQLATYLSREGFRLTENKERMTIATEGRELHLQTIGRYTIFIDKEGQGSKATIRGEWSMTQQAATSVTILAGTRIEPGFQRADWSGGRPNTVIEYAVKMARSLGKVTFGRIE